MSASRLVLAPVTSSVGAARRFLVESLEAWGVPHLEWDAVQVVSELATNAVMHARSEFTVVLSLEDDLLRIEVHDQDERLPHRRHFDVHATTGRGLALVSTLSRSWGALPASGGKVVWCLVPREAREAEFALEGLLTSEDRLELS
ncbi:MAG: putative anti-sigma regulatory factor, serine/threonine protein kinase [Frankiales bacterium]|nr:putative anti-sigma regulatory factor, serine/threonine protein kinase [Frankiales bacterium]